jgi:DNA-binding CsgD family transcriptional regulator
MTDSLFNRKCLDVLHASSVKDYGRQIVTFAHDLGFDIVAAMVVTDHSPTLSEFQTVSNTPEGFAEEFANQDTSRIDPVCQHCKKSSAPLVWDRRTYASARERALWEHQAEFGYRSGVAVALHPGRNRHFVFGANWHHDRPDRVPHFKRIFDDLLEFTWHAQAAAFELSLPTLPGPGSALLARSELEALRWTMDGKTSWEVGMTMSLSEHHAKLLLRRAMQKLGCSTKYEAILRAIKLGLIQCE